MSWQPNQNLLQQLADAGNWGDYNSYSIGDMTDEDVYSSLGQSPAPTPVSYAPAPGSYVPAPTQQQGSWQYNEDTGDDEWVPYTPPSTPASSTQDSSHVLNSIQSMIENQRKSGMSDSALAELWSGQPLAAQFLNGAKADPAALQPYIDASHASQTPAATTAPSIFPGGMPPMYVDPGPQFPTSTSGLFPGGMPPMYVDPGPQFTQTDVPLPAFTGGTPPIYVDPGPQFPGASTPTAPAKADPSWYTNPFNPTMTVQTGATNHGEVPIYSAVANPQWQEYENALAAAKQVQTPTGIANSPWALDAAKFHSAVDSQLYKVGTPLVGGSPQEMGWYSPEGQHGTIGLDLAGGKTWTPSGASSGITYHPAGEVIYNKVADPGTWGKDATYHNAVASINPYDYYEISGDMSDLLGRPDSNVHANIKYVEQNGKLVPIENPNVWNYSNHGMFGDLINSPIANIGLAIATGGLSLPEQLAASTALGVAQGKDLGGILTNAAGAYLGSQITGLDSVKDISSSLNDISPALSKSFDTAISSGVKAGVQGKDIIDAALSGAVTGGTSGLIKEGLDYIPGFDDLSASQQKLATNLATKALTGDLNAKSLENLALSSAIGAGTKAISSAAKSPSDNNPTATSTPEPAAPLSTPSIAPTASAVADTSPAVTQPDAQSSSGYQAPKAFNPWIENLAPTMLNAQASSSPAQSTRNDFTKGQELHQIYSQLTPEMASVFGDRGITNTVQNYAEAGSVTEPTVRSVLDTMTKELNTPQKFAPVANTYLSTGQSHAPLTLAQLHYIKSLSGMAKGGLPSKYHEAAPEGHNPEFITGLTGYYANGRGTGQSDDIPAMLHDGDYVMDADTVAALGDGSSKAGAGALQKFQHQIPHHMSEGGTPVAAKIADGEYVLPESFVTALGGGDNKHGAKLLDAMRRELREHKRSAPTSKIPPKAKAPIDYLKQAKG